MTIIIQDQRVTLADWLPKNGWSFDDKGYVIYTSRRKQCLIKRGEKLHRVTMRVLMIDKGIELTDEMHVHHQDFNKANNCPCNLIACPMLFNPRSAVRCPYTGRYMSKDEYLRMVA